jgi:hypothetical protein
MKGIFSAIGIALLFFQAVAALSVQASESDFGESSKEVQLIPAEEVPPYSPKVPHAADKFNASTAVAYRVSAEGLRNLSAFYHALDKIPVLEEVHKDQENLRPSLKERFVQKYKNFVLAINPARAPWERVTQYIDEPESLKKLPGGFALVGWFLPNGAVKDCGNLLSNEIPDWRLEPKENRLLSILDLRKEHLPLLEAARRNTMEALTNGYGVDADKDTIRMFFHFPYITYSASLHLHVEVNTPLLPLRAAKSYDLDLMISALRMGTSVEELVLQRQSQFGALLTNFPPIELPNLAGMSVELVKNPFRKNGQ